MKIYDVIRRDRAIISSYISSFGDMSDDQEIDRIIFDFIDFLHAHMESKEEAFYRPLREYDGLQDLCWEARARKEVLSTMAALIKKTDPVDEIWKAYLRVMAKYLDDYFSFEEKEVLARVPALLDFSDEQRMGSAMKKLRNQHLGESPDYQPAAMLARPNPH